MYVYRFVLSFNQYIRIEDSTYLMNFVSLQLMLSGILGLILLAFKPRPRQKLRQHFITFLRINSNFVTFIAAICTFLASSLAALHLSNILSPLAVCRPVHILIDSSACTCRFDGVSANSTTAIGAGPIADAEIFSSYYRYINVSTYMCIFCNRHSYLIS